jgi:fatty acid desaturase
MARERSREPEAVRITSAAASRNEDIAARQKRYLLSMGIRTVCFVGAIVASMLGIHWLWPILIVAALVLPYVAVVMANAATTKGEGFALLDEAGRRRELGAGDKGS